MKQLQQMIGYTFRDERLLQTAMTHSSFANEGHRAGVSNERLEFLGDSVLGFVVAEYLYKQFPELPEGDLTRMRASLVCEKSLCGFAKKIQLGRCLLLGRGEQNTGGRERPSVLADAFEALIAAIFLDGGMEPAARFVLDFVGREAALHAIRPIRDYKTTLQEIVQQNPGESLSYVLTGESGPDHDKRFYVEVYLNSNLVGKGVGRSKKEAEQQAAHEALRLMGY